MRSHDPFFRLPTWSTALGFFWEVRLAAAILAIVCCLATGTCWARMGRSWSVGIVPEEKRELLCSGPFAVVRHPIYALSICLMVMTVCVAPTFAVAIMALLHVILMHVKARGEEAFLSAVHGQAYLDYCRQTGRFFPRQFFNRRQIETQM
jgi:protein-S-isoprenylcysteine O-methyltransferase Ste14